MGLSVIQMNEATTAAAVRLEFQDDHALVAAARRDPRAFGALYNRYVRQVYRYAYARLGSASAAEDATSQTFLQALQKLAQFRDGMFAAWLFRIAHNVVVDAIRRVPAAAPLDQLAERADPEQSTERAALAAAERTAFYRALSDLPEEQRMVIEMTISGFRGEEIAQVLGKTINSVKMLRWRSMASIKQRVAREGFLEVQE